VLGQPNCNCPADAARPAGHQRYLTANGKHTYSPLMNS
jgi:hypothetical protein